MKAICVLRDKKCFGTGKVNILDMEEPGLFHEDYVLIKNEYASIHHDDLYFANGQYKLFDKKQHADDNIILGTEGVGRIVKKGANTTLLTDGYYGYSMGVLGSFAEYTCVHRNLLIKIPNTIDPRIACASLKRGMAAHYLLNKSARLHNKDCILIHSVSSGVGHILAQFAKFNKLKIIGTVGSEMKKHYGASLCDVLIDRSENKNFAEKVVSSSNNRGVSAVFDGIGNDVYTESLKSLGNFGMYVNYGSVSGVIGSIHPILDFKSKSLFFHSPNFDHYKVDKNDRVLSAHALFNSIGNNIIRPSITEYSFNDFQNAFKDLQSGKAVGSTIIRI